MPQHEEHCLHSEKHCGQRGDEIHTWMDEFSQVVGGSHRDLRHSPDDLPMAIKLFGKKYGAGMVQQIFLDHILADAEEKRTKSEENGRTGVGLWTEQQDNYLHQNVLRQSNEELEASAVLKGKTKSAIIKRMKYLGLIRPQILKRSQRHRRTQRIGLTLERGQKLFVTIEVAGGSGNDVEFGFIRGTLTSTEEPARYERISGSKSFGFTSEVSGKYTFWFDNSFSIFADKNVTFHYHVENGRELALEFSI